MAAHGEPSKNGESVKEFLGLKDDDELPTELHGVIPKTDCPHMDQVSPIPDSLLPLNIAAPCLDCQETRENWLCLQCYKIHCSRYRNSHMVAHFEATQHPVALSYSDLSTWCYLCDTYVTDQRLVAIKKAAHVAKFGVEAPCSV